MTSTRSAVSYDHKMMEDKRLFVGGGDRFDINKVSCFL